MKRLISSLFIVGLVLVQGPGDLRAPHVEAQTAGMSTSAPGLPAGFSIFNPDFDRSDDQITQLNNLTIRGMSSVNLPAVIYASRDSGGDCFRYDTGSSGIAYPCPLSYAPTVLYQIQVNPDTILLLKNRNRASFGTFAIGDHINVYGFFDAGQQYIDALIVRNLDKPSVTAQGRYVQLNNMTLVSDPSSPYAPATFAVADTGQPCWYYSGPTGYRTSISTCPVPVTSFSMPPVAPSLLPYPTSRIYTVEVTGTTRLLDFSRRPIGLSELRMGDTVNIFGYYVPSTNTVSALIVRDLGIGNPVGNASLSVEVVDADIRCIQAPCGQMANVKVELRPSTSSGQAHLVQMTDLSGRTIFNNLPAGTYTVTAYDQQGRSVGQTVSLASGEQGKAYLRMGSFGSQIVRVVSPNGGEVWVKGASEIIRWEDRGPLATCQVGVTCIQPTYEIKLVPYYPPCTGTVCPAYAYREPYTIARNVSGLSYSWTVGRAADFGDVVPSGPYTIQVCGPGGCDASDSHFTISDGTTSSLQLFSVNPQSARIGATVTLSGSGFTANGNTVYMNDRATYMLPSYDGTTITWNGVGYLPWSCPSGQFCPAVMQTLPPGTYQMRVVNERGSSNSVTFQLQ